MIAVDTNILVYAHIMDSPWNTAAYQVVGDLASSGTAWAIPWHCIHEFFSVVTHRRIHKSPSTPQLAFDQIDSWLESPTLTLLGEGPRTIEVLRDLVRASRITGPAIYDARIAAVCLEHGISELWSADRDFSKFPSLRVRNPLVPPPSTRAGERRGRRATRSARSPR